VLAELMPDEPEVHGLLALLLLHDARRDARMDADGDLVLLSAQDRRRWDHRQIAEGVTLVERSLRAPGHGRGPYRLQAVIAALHDEAPTAAETDWAQIAAVYGELARLVPSPVVMLNRAVAVAMADGPQRGLALLDGLSGEPQLAANHLYHAARADTLARLGRVDEAVAACRLACDLAVTTAERRFLQRRLRALSEGDIGN
jgi:RNA polymerase sigma-70 factor (ECF subfamily)